MIEVKGLMGPMLLHQLVDELEVECPNAVKGCAETYQRQLADIHLREQCQYAEISCPDRLCGKRILRQDLAGHRHDDKNSGRRGSHDESENNKDDVVKALTTCADCLSEIAPDAVSEHRETCGDKIVTCVHAAYGCPWEGRRALLQPLHLPGCSYESMKGFFTIHDAQISTLTQENLRLRHQLTVLQGMMSILQRELDGVKGILGPWYRPDTLTVSPLASTDVQYVEQAADVVTPTESFGGEAPDFASYFPPAEDGPLQLATSSDVSQARQHQHRTSSSGDMFVAYARQRPPAPISPNPLVQATSQLPPSSVSNSSSTSSTVAPLNISTSLFGTLTSLHSSVVSLASAIDSLSRHQDVALTTEAMRMGEEVRSLRAVVNGLRMQVHAIMVDRNSQVTGRPPGETPPGPVSAANLPQYPAHQQQPGYPGIPGIGEAGPWPAPAYFGQPPLPRFGSAAPAQPVTKL
ncbi:hypothetical protein EIP91_006216 [Steccherinum ochraceum]|uniref:TRAF-type domain-containing protein n=1 Tax=Steccherinum ochraceum TaxID=92696 RepID=A0A4R0RGT7_9APHY|nr:hypothetical protein EIP91_006216 [Steccherinum ochraceum]